jgi:hypothetical protein
MHEKAVEFYGQANNMSDLSRDGSDRETEWRYARLPQVWWKGVRMNQPKFLPGQKVCLEGGLTFEIRSIIWGEEKGWRYAPGDLSIHYHERELEPLQEPQKKKLYAFWDAGFIVFKDHEEHTKALVRIPEYDIEYPEDKK